MRGICTPRREGAKKKMVGRVNEDVVRFTNEYILANKLSASYQNQAINASVIANGMKWSEAIPSLKQIAFPHVRDASLAMTVL